MKSFVFALAIVLAGCAHRPVGDLRFHNQPPIWRVNDRTAFPKAPAERVYNRTLYHADGFFVRRTTRALDVRARVRARDVNALDEVPDSTWFTNRIGVRELSVDELRRGANLGPSPFDHLPWKITGGKSGGLSIGYVFEDARGDRYILKFDGRDNPEMETAAHAIVHRILWACGYHVPEDYVGYVRPEDLVIGEGASAKNAFGEKSPLTRERFDRSLETVAHAPDGRIRVLASRFLPGKPIGAYAREGTRPDDPNDLIPHEDRRSLRGQVAIFAWLNHTDIQEDNTLDAFVRAPGGGFVMHYLIDFGKALGVMGHGLKWKTVGYTYRFDLGIAFKTLLGLGLWKRPWEDVAQPALLGVGLFDAEHYDPGAWQTNSPYWPYHDADRVDAFWGAKLLVKFTRAQLEAAVGEAQYSDPRAAAYMLETLVARQRKTARYWFDRVAPIDEVAVTDAPGGVRLCFTDLLLAHRLRDVATRYRIEPFDRAGRALAPPRTLAATPDGKACLEGVPLSSSSDAYTIVKLHVLRNAHAMPELLVHLARDRAGRMQVIGLRRR